MILAPRHFVRFLDGRAGDVATVAFLPLDLGAQMPTQATDVRIGRECALKLLQRHRLPYEKFQLIQRAIDEGWCFKGKSNHLEFVYVHYDGGFEFYTLVLKSAKSGQETWVVTFFRSKEAQLKGKRRRSTLIRSHKWTEAG
jgi:hypothetical protein